MFNSIAGIRMASFESNSTCRHWFEKDSMEFFNSKVYDDVFPLGQRGAIFITSEYQDNPKYTGFSLRYASRNSDGQFTITTLDDFMGYSDKEEAVAAAEAYQTFYNVVHGL
jgi:hypothetical protein